MEKNEKVKMLAALAQEADDSKVDWDSIPMTKNELFLLMAHNVVEQIDGLDEKEQLSIAMATITKLLAEKFARNAKEIQENVW